MPRVYEIRVTGCTDLDEALALQDPIARELCPEEEHPGPCDVPWSFGLGGDDDTTVLVLGVCTTGARVVEVADRVRALLGPGRRVEVAEGDPDAFPELVEQYRAESPPLLEQWPLLGLRLTTARLELRLPTDEELAELADLAVLGVHEPDQRPFLNPWTDQPPAERARNVLQRHWRQRGTWTPANWELDLAVFENGRPVGFQEICGRDFATLREVTTGSWLGLAHHGRGIGTEMRAAVLHLAFAGLGARYAVSSSFADNAPSVGVSRKLGYRPDGITRDVLYDRAVVSQRLRLSAEDWAATARPEVTVTGLEPCLELFGLPEGQGRPADAPLPSR
ncbi:GNAT family N-acetyltransferase [Streptomyces litchfieldiae]|uniref:GNAT family protein n=1 Tax=Streptomyces litchfieldiae TaxID=3075543 RepID=A0ABU2MMN9_9ACTN|nr:GNAT family protein [Streptomyces sp. DSM 44938]MDT0342875.1 GNAT family protein [Streptomyces sp. DSM 44938]